MSESIAQLHEEIKLWTGDAVSREALEAIIWAAAQDPQVMEALKREIADQRDELDRDLQAMADDGPHGRIV